MHLIQHRINDLNQSKIVHEEHGIEIDARCYNSELICTHEAFGHHMEKQSCLHEVISNYKGSGPVILNLKTEGIENRCIELMANFPLINWFFLDMSMPYLVKYALLAKEGKISGFNQSNLAVRFSEYEPIEYAMAFQGMAEWIWVDCFTHWPIDVLKKKSNSKFFKICLVSPELQGHSVELIHEWRKNLTGLTIEAICTKRPDLWG